MYMLFNKVLVLQRFQKKSIFCCFDYMGSLYVNFFKDYSWYIELESVSEDA